MKHNWKMVVTDIECYTNFFNVTIYNYHTKEKLIFEISHRKNQIKEICEWFKYFSDSKIHVVGFNSVHYDIPVINYIRLNYNEFINQEIQDINLSIKQFSDKVINEDFWWKDQKFKKYKYHHKHIDIDLYLFFAKSIRLSKKISLKSLGIQLNYHVTADLPFEPSLILNEEQMDELIYYNSVHDIGITTLLLEEMKEEVNLRQSIFLQYGIPCLAMDAPKISSQILAKEIENFTGNKEFLDKKTIRESINLNEVYLDKYRFKEGSESFAIYSDTPVFKTPYGLLKYLRNKTVTSTNDIKATINFENPDGSILKSDYMSGGLHGTAFKGELVLNQDEILLDIDISSYYPSELIEYEFSPEHLGKEFIKVYTEIRDRRLKAKHNGDKVTANVLKLCLNAVFGLLGNEFSYLRDEKALLQITLNGQMILTDLVEKLIDNGINVVYQNTDGLLLKLDKNLEEQCRFIVKEHGEYWKMEWEFEQYKKCILRDVNNYINVKMDGSLKKKGYFVTKPTLGDSVNSLIIPHALQAYYKDGISPEKYIKEQTDIFLFCNSKKVDKSYEIYYGDLKLPQRLNRYYMSKKGKYLYKKKKTGKLNHMNKGNSVMLYNIHEQKPIDQYSINYEYYIAQVNDVIADLNQNKYQLSLF